MEEMYWSSCHNNNVNVRSIKCSFKKKKKLTIDTCKYHTLVLLYMVCESTYANQIFFISPTNICLINTIQNHIFIIISLACMKINDYKTNLIF